MPLNLGSGISSAGDDIGNAIARMGIQMQKDKQDHETVQAMLDSAKQMQVPDMRTGKPKNFFSDDQLHHIQRLIDQKKYHAAGAMEATFGIGKDMFNRIQTAAAKQQAALDAENQRQRAMQQGPVLTTVPGHGNYRWTGKEYVPDTAVPRNQMGLSAEDQLNLQRGVNKDANQAQTAQFKAQEYAKTAQTKIFNAFLKSNGIDSPTDLFDPTIQQGGVASPQTGFVQTDPANGPQTHIRFYHKPPEVDDKGNPILNAQGNPVGGKFGVTLPTSQVVDMQNAAASLAGPQAVQALQWLRENPDNKHASAVAAEISKRMGEIDQAPAPVPFNPTPPSQAPAQAPAAAYPQDGGTVSPPANDDDLSANVTDQ